MIIYTAIFGGVDTLKQLPEGITGTCFADVTEPRVEKGWNVVPGEYTDEHPRRRYSYYKYHPHILFPGQTTLWIDGSYELKILPPEVAWGAFRHPEVNTTKQEIALCKERKKLNAYDTDQAYLHLERYKVAGFKDDNGHPETGFMVRQDTLKNTKFNEVMWEEVLKGVLRDQICCDYARWACAITWTAFDGVSNSNKYAVLHSHYVLERRPQIYYFVAYDGAGLGVAYNKCCALVPDDAWVCLLDSDIMLMPSDFGKQIEEVLMRNPQYDVYTCLATRCHHKYTQLGGEMSEEESMVKLREQVVERQKTHYGKIKPIPMNFSGYFLLFRKSLWKEVPFREVGAPVNVDGEVRGGKVLGIDTQWHYDLEAKGKRACCMEGVVAIHYYRLGMNDLAHKQFLEGVATKAMPIRRPMKTPLINRPVPRVITHRPMVRGRAMPTGFRGKVR